MTSTSNKKRYLIFLVLSCAATFLFRAALGQYGQFSLQVESVHVRVKEAILTIESIKVNLDNSLKYGGEVTNAAIWNETENQTVTGILNRTSALRVLTVYGDPALLYHAAFVTGAYPLHGDEIGCALDEQAAYLLFGSLDAVGNTLHYEGNAYLVRGVFSGMDGVMVVQSDTKSVRTFQAAAFRVSKDANGKEAVSTFLYGSLGAGDVIIDLPFIAKLIKALSLLPAFAMTVLLFIRMMSGAYRLRKTPLHSLAAIAAAILCTVLLLYGADIPFSIPERFIPTKWSDFAFWSRLIAQAKEGAAEIRSLSPLFGDLPRVDNALGCAIFSCASVGFFISAYAIRPNLTARQWFYSVLIILMVTFVSLLIVSKTNAVIVESNRAIFVTWPTVLTCTSLMDHYVLFRVLGKGAHNF